MGYSYTQTGKLCCDRCNARDGVRKRTCPHKSAFVFDGPNWAHIGYLPTCPPPALCGPCWAAMGKARLHDPCKGIAERNSARELATLAKLEAGEAKLRTQWGDWFNTVPTGFIGMLFRALDGTEFSRIRPKDSEMPDWLSEETPEWQPWQFSHEVNYDNHERTT